MEKVVNNKYRRVHVSFQSTGPCNLGSVNSISSGDFYMRKKPRGRGGKFSRYIEMNMVREVYLSTYCEVDRLDRYIASAGVGYRSWRYYHSHMKHAKAMAIAVAYSLYQECVSGDLKAEWKLTEKQKPFKDFQEFQQKLGEQMMGYNPLNQHYPGDENQRVVTQTNKKQRESWKKKNSMHQNKRGNAQDYKRNVSRESIKNCLKNGRCSHEINHVMMH